MKAQGHDEIENLFRKGLGGYENEPDGHVWEGIQKGIKKKRRKLLWRIIFPSLLLVTALGAAALWYNNQTGENTETDVKTERAEKINPPNNSRHPAGFENPGEQHLTEAGKYSYNHEGNRFNKNPKSSAGNKPGRQHQNGGTTKAKKSGKGVTETPDQSSSSESGEISITESNQEANPAITSLTQADTLTQALADVGEEETVAEEPEKKDTAQLKVRYVGDETDKQVFANRFMVSVYAKPVWTTLPRMLDKPAVPSFVDQKNINLKMAAGLGMQYQLNKRLFVSAGFEYFRAEQDLNFTNYKYVENSKTVRTISSTRKIQVEVLKWQTLVPDKNYTYTNVFESFNYPLYAAYSVFATEKFNITATGGVAFTRIRWKSHDINDTTYYTGIANELIQKQRYVSVSIGAGLNYNINKRFTTFVNPAYGFFGKDLSQKRRGYGPKNQYYSVSAGIGFKF